MTRDKHDRLLEQDWSAVWERLPEAPEPVPRPRDTQITLRISAALLGRIKRVAAARSLPYHPLVRSWLLDALREGAVIGPSAIVDEPHEEQLNLKLDQTTLDALKRHADELRRPYHRLAREWIESRVTQEEERLGLAHDSPPRPALKDLMVLLLHATDRHGRDRIRGITRLQKLLFVIEQKLAAQGGFYAYNFGPFDETVNDTASALRLGGFLRGSQPVGSRLPSFAEMMSTVVERSGPRDEPSVEEFALNDRGHQAAERLRQSSRAYDALYQYILKLRQEWDTSDLVERVYEEWPKYAEKSLIREEVARRRAARRPSR